MWYICQTEYTSEIHKMVDKSRKTTYTFNGYFDNQNNKNGWLNMMTTRIAGTGSALPGYIMTNDDLSRFVDTSDEWITSRTGIKRRHIVSGDENAVTLAARAAGNALENAGVKPEEIQLVLAATSSAGTNFPGVACQVCKELGIKDAPAMDLSAACSGFIFSLNTAHAYIQSGIYEKILIIGVDTLSKVVDWKDRSTCVLFGDGAGACVAVKAEEGILNISQHSDGSKGEVLRSEAARLETPAAPGTETLPLQMDGQAVFKFAVKTVPECIRELLDGQGFTCEDVKYFVLHQANSRIIQSVAKRLHMPEDRFPMNLYNYGNTSAASIPVLLDELNRNGKLNRGDLLVMSGFGAGLTWGGTLLKW